MKKLTEKIVYVRKVHPYAITQYSTGPKKGRWKTYIQTEGGRKERTKSSEKEMYEYLYGYYKDKENQNTDYHAIFDKFVADRTITRNLSPNTVIDYYCSYKRFVTDGFASKKISTINETDVANLLKHACSSTPTKNYLKRFFEELSATFDFAVRKNYCNSNPAKNIDIRYFYKSCDNSIKSGEEKEFSSAEVKMLRDDAIKHLSDPRALMTLMAIATGMRAGELCALKKEDVIDNVLHIHRQQVYDKSQKPRRIYDEELTKNDRLSLYGGRIFTITPNIKRILELAEKIPGESEYIFHDPNDAGPIKKDGFGKNLRDRCKRLGIPITRNHAFRMALNTHFIDIGLSPAQRAQYLGHSVETNERRYSLTDQRNLADASEKLLRAEMAGEQDKNAS